jgi:hypothetical protein
MASVAGQIPCESKAWRKIPPLVVHGLPAGESWIAGKEQACGRIYKNGCLDSLPCRIRIEVYGAVIEVDHWEEWFPSQAEIESEFLRQLPCVRAIDADICRPLVPRRCRTAGPLRHIPHEVVRHSQTGRLAINDGTPDGIEIRIGICPPRGGLRAERHLMIPSNHAEIVVDRKNRSLRRPATRSGRKSAVIAGGIAVEAVVVGID